MFGRDKHSSLLGPFETYKETEGLLVQLLECLSPVNLSNLVYCLRVRSVAFYRGEHLNSDPFGYAPALLQNFRIGWKACLRLNTLAYLAH